VRGPGAGGWPVAWVARRTSAVPAAAVAVEPFTLERIEAAAGSVVPRPVRDAVDAKLALAAGADAREVDDERKAARSMRRAGRWSARDSHALRRMRMLALARNARVADSELAHAVGSLWLRIYPACDGCNGGHYRKREAARGKIAVCASSFERGASGCGALIGWREYKIRKAAIVLDLLRGHGGGEYVTRSVADRGGRHEASAPARHYLAGVPIGVRLPARHRAAV